MAFTITVVLTVGRVVLLVVADQVIEREAVVCGDEVNGVRWAAPVVLVQVRRTSQAGSELAQRGCLTAPEVTHSVAVFAVPLAPQRGEVANLVAVFTHIPGFCDQLDLADNRILLHKVKKRG